MDKAWKEGAAFAAKAISGLTPAESEPPREAAEAWKVLRKLAPENAKIAEAEVATLREQLAQAQTRQQEVVGIYRRVETSALEISDENVRLRVQANETAAKLERLREAAELVRGNTTFDGLGWRVMYGIGDLMVALTATKPEEPKE